MTVTSALAVDVHALLGEAVGEPHVLTAPGELITYARDATATLGVAPSAVVLPASTDEVQSVLRIAHQEALQLNVDIIVVNNPGCLRQYRLAVKHGRASVRVEHIAVLLAEAGRPSTDTARPGRRKT